MPSKTVIKFFAPVIDVTVNALLHTVDTKMQQGMTELVMLISSPGGSVFHGLSAYNDLRGCLSRSRRTTSAASIPLEVFVLNGRADDTFRMSQIDIADEFLSGFEILNISPSPRQKDHSMGVLSLEYPLDMAPGESWRLTISLRAKRRGVYIGDIDVLEGESFVARAAQAQVN